MRSASYRSSPDTGQSSPRRRAVSLLLTVLVHALLLLMLLRLAPVIVSPPQPPNSTVAFDIAADGEEASKRTTAKARSGGKPKPKAAQSPPPPPKAPTPDQPQPLTLPPGIILMTRQQFAANDVAKVARTPGAGVGTETADSGDDANGDEGETAAAGGGAEKLYDVDWYRRPTSAELSFYLPKRGGIVGWGMIACKTIADYRVDDCREIGQSPPGSGLSRAVREAAWQFRVMPPRIGNRPQLGTWVRIRIDYTERAATAR